MYTIQNILLTMTLLLTTGCTALTPNSSNDKASFSCEKAAKPKSLQLIEQQYRCNSHDNNANEKGKQ